MSGASCTTSFRLTAAPRQLHASLFCQQVLSTRVSFNEPALFSTLRSYTAGVQKQLGATLLLGRDVSHPNLEKPQVSRAELIRSFATKPSVSRADLFFVPLLLPAGPHQLLAVAHLAGDEPHLGAAAGVLEGRRPGGVSRGLRAALAGPLSALVGHSSERRKTRSPTQSVPTRRGHKWFSPPKSEQMVFTPRE